MTRSCDDSALLRSILAAAGAGLVRDSHGVARVQRRILVSWANDISGPVLISAAGQPGEELPERQTVSAYSKSSRTDAADLFL